MRIVTASSYEAAIFNLQQRQQGLDKAQMQLTSGKRVNLASDDPTAAARAERAQASMDRSDADKRSLDASRNVMSITESAMGDSVELLQTARETLMAAGNGTYSDGERKTLALKLVNIRNQLLSVANRPDGGGGFVFGGQGSATPPFVDTPSGVVFQGQSGELMASTGERLSLTVDGDQAWLKARSGNGVFTTAPVSGSNSGNAWITPGTVTAPNDVPYLTGGSSPNYTVQFNVSGTGTTYDILENGTSIGTGTFKPDKAIAIPGRGMSVTVKGSPANGDQFAIGEAKNDLNIFTSLNNVIAALNSSNQSGPAIVQAVNTGTLELDSVLTNMQSSRTAVGESLNRMDGIEDRIGTLKLAAATEKSNAEDLDMTQAISNFQNQQVGYQAALQSYASVQKLSLFQYING